MNSYWKQEAAQWVSITVLVSGLFSSVLLFYLYKIETNSVEIVQLDHFDNVKYEFDNR